MKALIIIPTFNEKENIDRVISEIYKNTENVVDEEIHILVVDDGSPDGTAQIVKEMQSSNQKIHIIEREKKLGLGTAYVRGFKYALENGYDYIFEMDADLSHDPKELPNFLREIKEYDLVLGSRYIKGVNVINWPLGRLLLSYFANVYTRIITGIPVKDSTGGFKCFRREVLENIDYDKIKSNGYSFQIEVNYKVWRKKFKIKEIPIIFVDRTEGESKMSKKIVREAIFMVWKLRFLSIIRKI